MTINLDFTSQYSLLIIIFAVIIGIVAIITLTEIIVLISIEIKKRKKDYPAESDKTGFYISRLNLLLNKSLPPKEKLDSLDITAKSFFREVLKLDNKSYSEIVEILKQSDPLLSNFCKSMIMSYYSNKELDKDKVNIMIVKFKEAIIRNQRSSVPQDKKEKLSLSEELERIFSHKKSLEKTVNELKQNPKIIELSNKKIRTEEDKKRLLDNNKNEFFELKKVENTVKASYTELKRIIERLYSSGSKSDKRRIRKVTKDWHKERKKNTAENPFKHFTLEVESLYKRFTKIGELLSR